MQDGEPLWLAGSVDNALRRVVRLGDGWFPNPPSPQVFTEQWDHIRTVAGDLGKDVQTLHTAVYTTLNINDDVVQAEREMRTFIEGYYHAPFDTMARRQSVCFGSAATCIAWLQDFIAAGVQTIVMRFGSPDQTGQMDRCARDVLPQVHRV